MRSNSLSVLLLAHNEVKSIENDINQIISKICLQFDSYEIIVVEDGSSDGTYEILHALNNKNGFISLKKSGSIEKVIICSGKIYFDLLEAREKAKNDKIIIFRIEQLYPFPAKSLAKALKPYAKNARFIWCQEEPKNMGAWFSVRDYIQWTLDNIKANNNTISYIGRDVAASPATGYAKRHLKQQKEIIEKVLN